MALLLLVIKAIFFFADGGYPDFNRVDDAGKAIPPSCVSGADCVYAAVRGRGPRTGPGGGRRDRRVVVHELLLERAVRERDHDHRS